MTLYDFCMERGDETLLREWDQDKNIGKSPENITAKSRYRAFWRCSAGHTWQSAVYSRASGCGCPYCAGKKVWPGYNDLASRFPQLAAQWHPTLNGSLTPEQVSIGCNKRIWWEYGDGHVWSARIDSRTGKNKCGCPVCAGQVKKARLAYYEGIMKQRPRDNSTFQEQESGRAGSLDTVQI